MIVDITAITDIRKARKISVVVAEQYARPLLPRVDHAFILENGSMVLEGAGQELLNNPDVKSAYFGL